MFDQSLERVGYSKEEAVATLISLLLIRERTLVGMPRPLVTKDAAALLSGVSSLLITPAA